MVSHNEAKKLVEFPTSRLNSIIRERRPYSVKIISGHPIIYIESDLDIEEFNLFRRYNERYLLPIIDYTGIYSKFVDLTLTSNSNRLYEDLAIILNAYAERRNRIPPTLRNRDCDEIRLLASLYVSNKELKAFYNPTRPQAISYNPFVVAKDVKQTADRLANQGTLNKRFFDRIHVCGSCNSSRLNVREDCLNCGSSELYERQIIHHFSCGFQGPETDFERHNELVCPKCHVSLGQYGSDYERSGTAVQCGACGEINTSPKISFLCMDCASQQSAQTMKTRDFFHYEINSSGISFLTTNIEHEPSRGISLQDLGLPLQITSAILNFLSNISSEQNSVRDFVLVEVSHNLENEVTQRKGPIIFEKIRAQILENLGNSIKQDGLASKGKYYDYLLIKHFTKTDFEDEKQGLYAHATLHIDEDTGLKLSAFDRYDLNCF